MQAAIAACHAEAASAVATDWPQIAALYGLLADAGFLTGRQVEPCGRDRDAGRPRRRSGIVDTLADAYHLLEATRADLLLRRGDLAAAADAYRRWLALGPASGPELR